MSIDFNGDSKDNKTQSAIGEHSIHVEEVGGVGCHLVEPLIPRVSNPSSSRTESNVSARSCNNENCNLVAIEQEEHAYYELLLEDGNSLDPAFFDGRNDYYSLDPHRFFILAIFCLNNLLGSAVWITFAPIEDAVEAKFRQFDHFFHENDATISNQDVNWLSMVSMAVYAPGTALCAWAIPKYGFRETAISSSFVMAIGCFFRWMSLSLITLNEDASNADWLSAMPRYFILLLGQALVSLGQTVFLNAPARVAASWFQQTTKPIGAINLFSNFGIILGQSLSPLCVVEETGEHLDQLLAGQAIAMGICALFTGLCFRDEEPLLPPSAAEAAKRREREQQLQRASSSSSESQEATSPDTSVSKDVKRLLTNPQYIVLLLALGIEYGLNSAIITLMQPWVASSGFPGDKIAGLCGSLLTTGGILGTSIAATLLDATQNFNQAIRWSFLVMFLAGIGQVAALHPECPTWLLATTFFITGMTQMPLLTICLDAAAAHTYPVPEELSSAGLQLVGCYLGMFLVDLMVYLMETPSGNDDGENHDQKHSFAAEVNVAYLTLLGLSSILACCYKSEDPRSNAGNSGEIIHSDSTRAPSSIEVLDNIDDNEGMIHENLAVN